MIARTFCCAAVFMVLGTLSVITITIASANPITIERFTRTQAAGPLAGVVAKIDLADPRARVELALTKKTSAANCRAQLETPSAAARELNFDLAVNASFFAAPTARDVDGKKVRYYVGNCAAPVGWHVNAQEKVSEPQNDRLRATLVMQEDERAVILSDAMSLPAKTRWAVSGNAVVVAKGQVVSTDAAGTRHPRTAAGLSADGKTLFLLVVDGRAPTHSIGANMFELGELLVSFGAHDAINLDGGGSTAMVIKDNATGVYAVANRPSEVVTGQIGIPAERPVVDIIGVRVLAETKAPAKAKQDTAPTPTDTLPTDTPTSSNTKQ